MFELVLCTRDSLYDVLTPPGSRSSPNGAGNLETNADNELYVIIPMGTVSAGAEEHRMSRELLTRSLTGFMSRRRLEINETIETKSLVLMRAMLMLVKL